MLVAKTSPSEPPDLWAKTALIIEGCVVSGILSWQHKVDSETVSSLSFHPPTLSLLSMPSLPPPFSPTSLHPFLKEGKCALHVIAVTGLPTAFPREPS